MSEFIDRLVKASEGTGWVAETASSILSLKSRFEGGEIDKNTYLENLNVLNSSENEIGAGSSFHHRAIIDNGIAMIKKML